MSTTDNMLPQPDEIDPIALANRRAKGKRPNFLEDPAVERVLSIAMAVVGELAVARERIDTLERVLIQRGVMPTDAIEAFVPDAEAQAARNMWGREYIARVLRMLEQDVHAMNGPQEPTLDQVIDELRDTRR
jgi:polyhydroxyalkanoate synthesis regulator phasin